MKFDSIHDVLAFLERIPMFGKVGVAAAHFDLEQIQVLLEALGNPHHRFPCVHVAGTNGKGSVCSYLSAVYSTAGYKVGLYTSPHLIRFNERIRIDGMAISNTDLLAFFQNYAKLLAKLPYTYFELSTAIAFWYFARERVDIAIVEVGLGGRLDATNVVNPLVSVITSIGYDHQEVLGETLGQIAREKAGIIKQSPVVIGALPDEARQVIRSVANEKDVDCVEAKPTELDLINVDYLERRFRQELIKVKLPIPTRAQHINISVVLEVVNLLWDRFPISRSELVEGLEHMPLKSGFRGRFERLDAEKEWWFDGGHNAEALSDVLDSMLRRSSGQFPVLIVAMQKDKLKKSLADLFSQFPEIYYYSLNTTRSATFADFVALVPQARPFHNNPEHGRDILLTLNRRVVLFIGSFYFYEKVTQSFMNRPDVV